MLAAKKIKLADESLALLEDLDLYDEKTGLNQKIESGLAVIF